MVVVFEPIVVLRFAEKPAPNSHANVGEWNRTTDAPAADGATTASAPHWPPCGILSDLVGCCAIAMTGAIRMDTAAKTRGMGIVRIG